MMFSYVLTVLNEYIFLHCYFSYVHSDPIRVPYMQLLIRVISKKFFVVVTGYYVKM